MLLFPSELNPVYLQSLLRNVGHEPNQLESGLVKRNGIERNVSERALAVFSGLNGTDVLHGVVGIRLGSVVHNVGDRHVAGSARHPVPQ